MNPTVTALLALQDLDKAIHAAEVNLEALPGKRAALESHTRGQRQALEAHQAALRQAEVDRKNLELEVLSVEQALARYRQQQMETRKNDEYAALAKEIEHGQEKIRALEDQELAVMLRLDEMAAQTPALQQALDAAEAQATTAREKFDTEEKQLRAKLEELRGQVQAAADAIDAETVGRYRRILASKKDAAVVSISHETCAGCHMKLTHATALQAKGGQSLAFCDNCGRIVYWQSD